MTTTRARLAVPIAMLVLVGALAGGAGAASLFFSDTKGFFEKPVDEIAAAGCAAGYPNGTFKPNNPATRGQFAYWTANCAGRLVHKFGNGTFDGPQGFTDVTQVQVETPGVPGALTHWMVNAYVTFTTTDASACPCTVYAGASHTDNDGSHGTGSSRGVMPAAVGDDGRSYLTLPVQGHFLVETGSTFTLALEIAVEDADVEDVYTEGYLTAALVPLAARQ